MEFEDASSVASAYNLCHHARNNNESHSVPVHSPFLWFSNQSLHNVPAQDSREESEQLPIYLPIRQDSQVEQDLVLQSEEKKNVCFSVFLVNIYLQLVRFPRLLFNIVE